MTTLAVGEDAEAELVATGDWYHANARAGVAKRFREAIEQAFSEVAEAPDAFPAIEEYRDVTLRPSRP